MEPEGKVTELFTFINLPGCATSWAERGHKTVEEMVAILRNHAAAEIKDAQEILTASSGDFHVQTARGLHVMHDRKVLQEGRDR